MTVVECEQGIFHNNYYKNLIYITSLHSHQPSVQFAIMNSCDHNIIFCNQFKKTNKPKSAKMIGSSKNPNKKSVRGSTISKNLVKETKQMNSNQIRWLCWENSRSASYNICDRYKKPKNRSENPENRKPKTDNQSQRVKVKVKVRVKINSKSLFY
jgi:hypothetical protein